MTDHPTISVAEDFDSGEFVLFSTAYGMTMPAGARLFKAPPHPAIRFRHATEADAQRDCALLQAYIAESWPKQAMSKAEMRRGGE